MTASDHHREPDPRFTLANERTYLAWLRTAVGLVASGFAVTHVVPELATDDRLRAIGLALMATGGLVPPLAHRHWRRVQDAMRRDEALPPHRLPSLLAAALVVATAALMVLPIV